MIRELPKVYDPQQVESKIYKMWEEGGFFAPSVALPRIPSIFSPKLDFTKKQIYVIMATSGFSAIHYRHGKYLHIEGLKERIFYAI